MRTPLAAAAVLCGLLLTACSPGLGVDAYPTEPDTEVDCKALFADAPQQVVGEDRIRVEDDNAVAWGAPPVIMRCGVEEPSGFAKDLYCDTVDGVDWYSETTADGFLFTTVGRTFRVSVEVPNDYDPAAHALTDLAGLVKKHNPRTGPCATS